MADDMVAVDISVDVKAVTRDARDQALTLAVEAGLVEFGADLPAHIAEALNCGIYAGVAATLEYVRDAYPEPAEDSLGGNTTTSTYEPAGDTTGGGK